MIRQTSIMATKKFQVHVDPNFKKIVISSNSGVLYEKGVWESWSSVNGMSI